MPSRKVREAIEQIKMKVVSPERRNGEKVMRWIDPLTGRWRQERTKTRVMKDAWTVAGDKALEVVAGLAPRTIEWLEFCRMYEVEHLARRSDRTSEAWSTVKYWIDEFGRPMHLHNVNDDYVVRWQAKMHGEGLAESSVAAYSTRLRAALNWAKKRKLIQNVPEIEVGEFRSRGRPVIGEEFDRMLMASKDVRPQDYKLWELLLKGIYWSGLRLGEIWRLSWDDDAQVRLDGSGEFPLIWISAKGQKARREDVQPIPDEFWRVCLEASGDRRRGHVFEIPSSRGVRMAPKSVSRVISDIGTKAGVKVDPDTGKLASAHDLRRSFAANMDDRLTVGELQKAMRHKDIRTTMKFYARKDALEIARKMRSGLGGARGGAQNVAVKSDVENNELSKTDTNAKPLG